MRPPHILNVALRILRNGSSHGEEVAVCQLTEGHPFYTQRLCHVLWEQCDVGRGNHARFANVGSETGPGT
jgi:hypothetical protein